MRRRDFVGFATLGSEGVQTGPQRVRRQPGDAGLPERRRPQAIVGARAEHRREGHLAALGFLVYLLKVERIVAGQVQFAPA